MHRRDFVVFLMFAACKKSDGDAEDSGMVKPRNDVVPGTERARRAAERVRGGLQADLARLGLRVGNPVFLRAFKEEEVLELWVLQKESGRHVLFRKYPVAAWSGSLGPKLAEGDGQVPEGFYAVGPAAMKPDSDFHLAFNIGYPNAYDRHHGRTGSFIMIHGNRVSSGCLAMTDEKIEEIYTLCDAALREGQPFFRVHIFPFRMTETRMAEAAADRSIGFWREIQAGYRWFEQHRVPPEVIVRDGAYRFSAGD